MKTLIIIKVELLENGTSDLHLILQEDSSRHCPETGTRNLHFFSKSNMAADENTNSAKELNNVKTLRPISAKFGTKNFVATVYTLGCSKSEFYNSKMKNLNKRNLNKYVSITLQYSDVGGALYNYGTLK